MKKIILSLVLVNILIGLLAFDIPTASGWKWEIHKENRPILYVKNGNAGGGGFGLENPLRYSNLGDLIDAIVNFLFQISLIIAPLFIIIAGFYFVTAAGDPQKIETAKRIILYTLIGLLVIITSKGIIALVKKILGVS